MSLTNERREKVLSMARARSQTITLFNLVLVQRPNPGECLRLLAHANRSEPPQQTKGQRQVTDDKLLPRGNKRRWMDTMSLRELHSSFPCPGLSLRQLSRMRYPPLKSSRQKKDLRWHVIEPPWATRPVNLYLVGQQPL